MSKKSVFFFILFLSVYNLFAYHEPLAFEAYGHNFYYRSGIGLGSAIAVVLSWERNKSILWAILAGLLSWIYVIYFALTRKDDEVKR